MLKASENLASNVPKVKDHTNYQEILNPTEYIKNSFIFFLLKILTIFKPTIHMKIAISKNATCHILNVIFHIKANPHKSHLGFAKHKANPENPKRALFANTD